MLGTGSYLSAFGERQHPVVVRTRIPIPGLPADLDGFKICQISDLHRGRWVPEAFLRRAMGTVSSLKPDLVAITGDFVSYTWRNAESCAAVLSDLEAPYGVYGVLGNHDHSSGDPARVIGAIEDAGVRVLVNQAAPLTLGSADWWLCGVDDTRRGAPDLDQSLAGVPAHAFRILLCHEPDFADRAVDRGFALQLSGHSHGGQIVLPGDLRPILPPEARRYPYGLRRVAGSKMQVYTNAGLGVIGIPIRWNCHPEITLHTLTRA